MGEKKDAWWDLLKLWSEGHNIRTQHEPAREVPEPRPLGAGYYAGLQDTYRYTTPIYQPQADQHQYYTRPTVQTIKKDVEVPEVVFEKLVSIDKTSQFIEEQAGRFYGAKCYNYNPKNIYDQLIVSGMITGCGILQAQGIGKMLTYSKESLVKFLKVIKESYQGVGMLLITLSPNQYADHHALVIELGFKELVSFNNWGDDPGSTGKGHIQHVYGYTFDRPERVKPQVEPVNKEMIFEDIR